MTVADSLKKLENLLKQFEVISEDQLAVAQTRDSNLKLLQDTLKDIDKKAQSNQSAAKTWEDFRKDRSVAVKNKGNEALNQGKNYTAVFWFTVAILLDPSNAIFFSNRSAAYANLGLYEQALKDAEQTIALSPNWAKGYSRKGVAAFYLHKYDDALDAYQKGLALEPDNDILKKGLEQLTLKVEAENANEEGEKLAAKGKYVDAIKWFDQAIAKDPTQPGFFLNRAECHLQTYSFLNALNDADTAINLRPKNIKGYVKRAEALSKMNRFDEAASTYATALQLDPGNTKLQQDMNNAIQDAVRHRIRTEYEAKQKEDEKKKQETEKNKQNTEKK